MARSKVKSMSHHDIAHLHPQPMFLPSINFLHLTVSEIWSRQDFQTQGHYGKVKSRSHHDIAQLYPLTNVPTKYQFPTPTVSEIQSGQTFKTFKILFNLFLGNSKVYEVDIW